MEEKAIRIFDSKVSAGGYASRKNRKARKYFYTVRKSFGKNEFGVFKVRVRR